uniref:ATP synthase subunit a n=1 Tax=Phyllomimus sp. YH-2018 TaxID=2100095 RepID=A0A343UWB4_9ORTH|nr:ATP synthase F0 subunit 6 [Phyllomimus sp. YH-2018]
MMMTSLFSVFDPSTSIITSSLSLNWSSMMLGFMFIPLLFWFIPSRLSTLWLSINKMLHFEFKLLLGINHQGTSSIFIPLFLFLLFNNFLGLFPYIFTSSSHLSMTLSLALPLWLSFMIFGWMKNTKHMFAHLMPQGTPPLLMPFMVCIESISNMIRPGTLAIRLAANMIAGHLLLTLLGSTGPSLSNIPASFLIIIQIALLLLESAVAIIQAYVFTILITLYASEVK